jgi:hypothetical protein
MANFDYEPIVVAYRGGKTATIESSVLDQPGADFSDVTNNTDYIQLMSGTLDATGDVLGRYLITAHTTDTVNISGYTLGDSTGGDIEWELILSGNLSTMTIADESLILDLRRDVDYLGELLSMTGDDWTANNYDWTVGTTEALSTDDLTHMTYFSDLRSACEDLYTAQSLGSPSWTITSLVELYDVSDDIISANRATMVDLREDSLYEDIRTAILAVASTVFYYVDAVNGNDTTGDGSAETPYKTWNKAVTVLNAAGTGNLYFQAGTYTMDVAITADNTHVRGSAVDEVTFIHDLGTSYIFSEVDGIVLEKLHFRKTVANPIARYARRADDMTVTECLFTNEEDAGASITILFILCGNLSFNHCSFLGTPTSLGARTAGVVLATDTDTTFTDCAFVGFVECIRFNSSSDAVITDCGFYDFGVKYALETPTEAGTIWTDDPEILDRANGHLSTTSPYIDQASDGFDIGAWIDGPYNTIVTIAETLKTNDVPTETVTTVIEESLAISEDITITNFNINVDMFGGGLLNTTSTGVATYLSSSDIIPPAFNGNFQYDGAFMDVSFDNALGNQMKVYIVDDDTVTNYENVSWWIANATYPAATTSLTYAINCYLDAETNDEFGERYTFTTVTADGDNDKQADLKLKLRIHNVSLNEWSELVSISKTYYLNDFNISMYYCADNPRLVDGEYANHANYYSQPFHTGTNKYTRADGVDWADDDRKYAYNPAYKVTNLVENDTSGSSGSTAYGRVYEFWKYRYATLDEQTQNLIGTIFRKYACINANFMNYNDSSGHGFDNSSPFAVAANFDGGTANFTSPVMSTSSSNIRYLSAEIEHSARDCVWHNSHTSSFILLPNDEILAWGTFTNRDSILDASDATDLFYEQSNAPDATPCTTPSPGNFYYLKVEQLVGGTTDSSGKTFHPWSGQLFHTNTDHLGNYLFGELRFQKSHQATSSFTDSW